MSLDNNFWDRVKNKTQVSKDTIVSLAKKLQTNGMKDENTLNEVIDTLSKMTGKNISDEKKQKIINKVKNEDVPDNIDKMF